MKFPWAICLAREDAPSLGSMRLQAGVEVAEAGNSIRIRGPAGDDSLQTKLAALRATARFEWLAPNRLRLVQERIPSTRLPDLRWQPLSGWLRVEFPIAALPGSEPAPMPLSLVRSVDEQQPQVLLASLADFKRFVATAPQARLQRLHFAADAAGNVLIRGTPLPPLPGRRFAVHGGVAVPAGFAWEPAVSVEVLARKLGASADALVLWNEDGTLTRLHSEQFVATTPSAVRATEQALIESE